VKRGIKEIGGEWKIKGCEGIRDTKKKRNNRVRSEEDKNLKVYKKFSIQFSRNLLYM
jgi:hypothetical protein